MSLSQKIKKADASPIDGPIGLQDLPVELLEHIISFLPALSIRNLMVNRAFRQICERILYRSIRLPYTPGRTIHLCKTFVLRPDLALHVQDLDVCLQRFYIKSREGNREYALSKSQKRTNGAFTPVEALALAKNVKSFSVRGTSWASERDMAPIRELAGGMKLTRLTISIFPTLSNLEPGSDKEVVSYLRAVLQAQPLLEQLEFPNLFAVKLIGHDFPSTPTTPSVELSPPVIERSDVPNLRSLIATVSVAVLFLPVAPKLERLSISSWGDQISYLLPCSEQHGQRIRRLGLRSRLNDFVAQGDLAKLLSHFPNVETCIISVYWWQKIEDLGLAGSSLDWVSRDIHLPLLRELEIYSESEHTLNLKLSEEQMMELKRSCPRLESVIDHSGDIWTYCPIANQEEVFRLRHLGRLSPDQQKLFQDIPSPDPPSETPSSRIWAIWK
ncbi:hypothetical protein FRC04_010725 [Tulasnella sp. 424]|nr:hypothetical protein FRC04_010725 [Tulasnella sp. 424]KAG8962758.1 hypothetical protein FRC05_005124 [Tulasnella sp. 425]